MYKKKFFVLSCLVFQLALSDPASEPDANPVPKSDPSPSSQYFLSPFRSRQESSGQFLRQDNTGQYAYGYNNPGSSKTEIRTNDGTVRGSYSYLSPDGRVVTNDYVADRNGFRSSLDPANPLLVVEGNPIQRSNSFRFSNSVNPNVQALPVYPAFDPRFNNPGYNYPPNPQIQTDLDHINYGQTIRGSVRIPYPNNPSNFNPTPSNPSPYNPLSINYNPLTHNGINYNPGNERNYAPNRLGSIFQSYPTSPFYGSNIGLGQVDSTSNQFGQDQFYKDPNLGRRNPLEPRFI